jgi:putative tricarboxylic transport membrane protein
MSAELLHSVTAGFQVSLLPANLLYALIGTALGTLIGVLPGVGSAGTIALLLPITLGMPPVSAIIFLSGIYYGAMYGGSTTSILVNIPGEAASVVTCLDGYQMARQGRAGPALGMAAMASFIGATLSILGLMLVTPLLAGVARDFGPPEYFALVCLGVLLLVFLGTGSMIKSLMAAGVGFALSLIGQDIVTGQDRFTFGVPELKDGIGLVPLFMGLFGIAEVLANLEGPARREIFATKIGSLWPTLKDWMAAKGAILRGTVIGFFLGILPGGSAVIASFVSYATEKMLSRHPERFGTGVIEGVAGPETANNAAAQGAFIPLFALGLPTNATTAILLAAFVLHGVRPGPMLIEQTPDLFWGVVTSMYVGNIMLLVFNLPMIGVWVQILKVPYRVLLPLIVIFSVIGTYSIRSSTLDVGVMILFGALGYAMRRLAFDATPLVLAFILGPMLEQALRQSLILSRGSFSIFVTRPIAAGFFFVIAVLVLVAIVRPFLKRNRA